MCQSVRSKGCFLVRGTWWTWTTNIGAPTKECLYDQSRTTDDGRSTKRLSFFYLAPILSFRFSDQSIFSVTFIGELHFKTELVLLPSVVEFYDIYFNQC
jgi:hypothetical protein